MYGSSEWTKIKIDLFMIDSLFLSLFFLIGTLILSLYTTIVLLLGRFKAKEFSRSSHFFFRRILLFFFPYNEWQNLYFSLSLTKHITQLAYATTAFLYLAKHFSFSSDWMFVGIIVAISLFTDFLIRLLANAWPLALFKIASPLSSCYLLLFFPLVGLLLKCTRLLLKKVYIETEGLLTDKTKIKEMIRESELHLDATDQKLIGSFLNFKERVAKEIMVPRVDLYALASDTTIQEAASLFAEEGYSRIPIYRESLDQILGVILYKDLLKCYANPIQELSATLETIAKPVLYAPENKKITQLLQEFRNKQIHMAIIVDEYGGTEGIVTIEDILEELVGEIEDEYDVGEEHDFWEIPGGGWVVDSKMTLFDIEERIGVRIPPNPEYETVGGYIYHCAGTIPSKGWRLSHDQFDLEVISSNERSIKKVKIQPRSTS